MCKQCARTIGIKDGCLPYTPEWKRVLIQGLRKQGFSVRQITGMAGVSKNTVEKYSKGIIAHCPCGRLSTHRGWCAFRYKQTARRQQFIQNWIYGTSVDPKTLPGLYTIQKCPVCGESIELAQIHRKCWIQRAADKRADQQVSRRIFKKDMTLKEVERLLIKIKETINDTEKRQNRRPTRSTFSDS